MGVWKITTEVVGAVEDGLAGHINDVSSEAGKSLDAGFDVFRRARAPSIVDQGGKTASVGVWLRPATTGAASQKQRRWQADVMIDYTYRGQDRDEVAEQVELAARAIMRVVDDVTARDTIATAGDAPQGTTTVHDLDDMIQEQVEPAGPYMAACRVQFPVEQREDLP